MLHPSYSDLINVVNKDAEEGDQLVQSRYSIVIATAKRAREIIKSNKPSLKKKKALSIAIDEIYNQKVKIILGEEANEASENAMPVGEMREEAMLETDTVQEDAMFDADAMTEDATLSDELRENADFAKEAADPEFFPGE